MSANPGKTGPVPPADPAPTAPGDTLPDIPVLAPARALDGRTEAAALSPGMRMGNYRLESPLGRGGMGTVWRAYDERLGRWVALKAMADRLLADERSRARFEREARSLARVVHPNLVHLYEVGEDRGFPFLVMELVEGEPLSEALKRRRRLSPAEARRCVRQVASALSAVHRAGVIHRDVKPANVLLCDQRGAVLTDFGLARYAEPGASLTMPGMVFGTPEYMSPEQALGETLDERSDLYALGAIWYELVSGAPPFGGGTVAEILRRQVQASPAPLRPAAPVSEAEESAILRCLEKDRARRFATAEEMRTAIDGLDAALAAPPSASASGAPRPGGGSPRRTAAICAAAAAAMILLWAGLTRRGAIPHERAKAWLSEGRIERFLADFRPGRLSTADRRETEADRERARSALKDLERRGTRYERSGRVSRWKLLCIEARDSCMLGDAQAAREALEAAVRSAPDEGTRRRSSEAASRIDHLFPPPPAGE